MSNKQIQPQYQAEHPEVKVSNSLNSASSLDLLEKLDDEVEAALESGE